MLSADSEPITDASTSYVKLKDIVGKYQAQAIPKEKVGSVLPWIHIAISNAKRMLLDIYHDIKPECLQNHLDKFCYNFNRRYFGESLLIGYSLFRYLTKISLGIVDNIH